MARGKTLISLLDDLRSECRRSKNPAHNAQVRDSQVDMLQRVQEWLWEEFTWPHLRVERDIPLEAGQRFFSPPADIAIDRIEKIEIRDGGSWLPMHAGIDRCHYNSYDSDLDVRSWPVMRWKIAEDEQIEVWPIPAQDRDPVSLDGTMRVTGIRNLAPLVADTDRADLDSRLIVLYAAAETLAAGGSKDANLKLSQANKLFGRLRSNLTPRRKISLFSSPDTDRRILRGPPSIYYRTTT